jgi:predicted DNA-binding transcriptional regulator YafY
MSRTDILFQMTQIIRSRKYTTAAYLSDRLGLSVRTVYRYINDLSLAGVPVVSQTGKGYWIDKSFDMPPIQLTADELLALSLGSRLVKAIADPFLADAAQQLVDKVESVIPASHQHLLYQSKIHAPKSLIDEKTRENLGKIRRAIDQQQKVELRYSDEKGNTSQRVIWPLVVAFWGPSWTVAAWCEQRDAFRAFRLDRIIHFDVLTDTYPQQTGKTLADFIALQAK